MTARCLVVDLGCVDYDEAEALQHRLVEKRWNGDIEDHLLLLEHPPVVTLGRDGEARDLVVSEETLRDRGVAVRWTNRGGRATFHGPGQLVGYPILDLQGLRPDVRWYLRRLEEALILALRDHDFHAERWPHHAGVGIGGRKVASIGVAVRRWVTYHGFALNIETDLSHFGLIHACGMESSVMASLEAIRGARVSKEEVVASVIRGFGEVFAREMTRVGRLGESFDS